MSLSWRLSMYIWASTGPANPTYPTRTLIIDTSGNSSSRWSTKICYSPGRLAGRPEARYNSLCISEYPKGIYSSRLYMPTSMSVPNLSYRRGLLAHPDTKGRFQLHTEVVKHLRYSGLRISKCCGICTSKNSACTASKAVRENTSSRAVDELNTQPNT
jgi:hypothetical protein